MTIVSLRKIWKPALLALLFVLNCFAARNLLLFALDFVRGDGSAKDLSPRPIYSLTRVPARSVAARAHRAVGRLGSDFAQVYFPAQDIVHLENAFDAARTLDPWSRPSRYAPLVILACAGSFCRLPFGYACLLEMLFQTLVFYAALYWACSITGLRKYFLFIALFINLFLFVTPVGLTWFERGQFSLYLAAAYTVLMLSLLKKQPAGVAVAAALAFVKWTSYPALFVVLAVYLLSSRSLAELKSNAILVGVFAATTIALVLLPMPFFHGTDAFVRGLFDQELSAVPKGISLLRYAPRLIVKLLPLAAIAVGCFVGWRNPDGGSWLIPYAAGVVGLMLLYPTLAYEYALPSLWGFLLPLLFWARQDDGRWSIGRAVFVLAFLLFMATASFSTRLVPSLRVLVDVYLAFSVILMLSPRLRVPGRLAV